MAIDRGTMSGIMVGAPVFTQDGTQIGTVKEIQGRFFKVDAPMQPDFWLSDAGVRSAAGGQVTLAVDQDHLDQYKTSHPSDDHGDHGATMHHMAAESPATARMETATSQTTTPPAYNPSMTSAELRTWQQVEPTYQRNWEQRYGNTGERWQDLEPVYRYNYEMWQEPQFRGHRFEEVEPQLRAGYPAWAQRSGYPADTTVWERERERSREAWEGMGTEPGRLEDLKAYDREHEGERTIPLREERLTAERRPVEGAVDIRKEVVSEQKTIDVPVTREEVVIEEHPVQQRPADAPIGAGDEVRIPVRGETATAEKQTMVTGELDVRKREVQDTERISGTVRREEVRIEREGDVQEMRPGSPDLNRPADRNRPDADRR